MITLVEVRIVQTAEVKIPVRLSYISHAGSRVNRLAGKKDFLKALGIVV